jgi:hypothetical protein
MLQRIHKSQKDNIGGFMNTSDREKILGEIESRLDVRLPNSYREFILSDSAGRNYLFAGRRWFLSPLSETGSVSDNVQPALSSIVTVSGKDSPFTSVLELHAQTLSKLLGVYTNDASGNSYGVNRLGSGIAIGEAEGDILYLDRLDRFSVWCYYQSSGNVELLAKTFETWLEKATPDLPEPVTTEPKPPIEDPVVQIRSQRLKSNVRKAIDRYISEYLIPWGDLDATRVYSNVSNKILEKGYDRAMDQVATEIVNELTRTDTN